MIPLVYGSCLFEVLVKVSQLYKFYYEDDLTWFQRTETSEISIIATDYV